MEERRSELVCRVCGDKASGKHYGVPSCDGCRGFFKRSIRRCRQNLEYVCKESGRCVVDVARRNQCQACRFTKCLQVNMRREAVQHERAPRSCVKRQPSLLSPDSGAPLLLPSPMFPHFGPYGTPFPQLRPFPLVPPPFLGSCGGSAFTPVRPAAPFWSTFEPPPVVVSSAAAAAAMAAAGANAAAAAAAAAARQQEPTRREEPLRREETQERAREELPVSHREEQEVSSSQIDVVRVDSPLPEIDEPLQSSTLLGAPAAAAVSKVADRTIRGEPVLPPPAPVVPPPAAAMFRTPAEPVLETAAKLLFLAVHWAHTIPSFLQMSTLEQRALLEASWSELFVISAAQWPLIIDNPSELAASCGSAHPQQVALQLASLSDLVQRFADLKVDHTEYACLRALVLFKPEVKSVRDSKLIEALQDQTHLMLYEYVFSQKVAAKARFGRLLLLLSSLKTVSSAFIQEAFFKRSFGGVPISQLLADLNGNSASI